MTEIRQEEAASLKPGRYVIFDGKACIVKDNQISKTGKHGHAKCRIDAISIVASQRIVKMIMGITPKIITVDIIAIPSIPMIIEIIPINERILCFENLFINFKPNFVLYITT